MDKFRFWKRKPADQPHADSPVIKKFNVSPRTDVGTQGLPADPENASRVAAMRRRRESIVNELEAARSANEPNNRWRQEIKLIE